MNALRSIYAIIIGGVMMFLFSRYVSLPILPCATVYTVWWISLPRGEGSFVPSLILTGLFAFAGTFIYSLGGVITIMYYPMYGNFLVVISYFLTAFASAGAGIVNCKVIIEELKDHRLKKRYLCNDGSYLSLKKKSM